MSKKSKIVGDGYLVELECSLNYNMVCIFLGRKQMREKAVEIEMPSRRRQEEKKNLDSEAFELIKEADI